MKNILPQNGEIYFIESFLTQDESAALFRHLQNEIEWEQKTITLFGKTHPVPRLLAWYGDPGATYTYSNTTLEPKPWTQELKAAKEKIEKRTGASFNSVLLNYYRHGKDYSAWHRDNEKELGENPVIASLSLGQKRPFKLRHKFDKTVQKISIDLPDASLLLMKGEIQRYWEHQIPKTAKSIQERINLTFRKIII